MVKIRPFQFTDRYDFEKLISENYTEKKAAPPESNLITEAVGFYAAFPQCGKIYMILFNSDHIGYFIVNNEWNIYEAKICYNINDIYINKNFRKYKAEVKMIEYLIKHEKVASIKLKIDKNISKKVFKFFNFERDFGPYFIKKVDLE